MSKRVLWGAAVIVSLIAGSLSVLALVYTFTIGHKHLWVGVAGLVGVFVFARTFRKADAALGTRPGPIRDRPRLGRPDEMRRPWQQ